MPKLIWDAINNDFFCPNNFGIFWLPKCHIILAFGRHLYALYQDESAPPDDALAWTISSSYNRDSRTREGGGGSGSGRQNEREGGGGSGSGRQIEQEGGSGSGRVQRESGSGSGSG